MRLGPAVASDYLRCIQNNLELKNYTAAAASLENALRFWPRNEDFLIQKIQYADAKRQLRGWLLDWIEKAEGYRPAILDEE